MEFLNVSFDRLLAVRLAWTALFVGGAYLLGHLSNLLLIPRLRTWASRTQGAWDDIILEQVRRRIPFWSLLTGARLSLGQWSLTPSGYDFATALIKTLAIASFTFALSSIATRLIAAYGTRATSGVPVSGLTQNIARIVIVLLGLLVIARGFGFEITPYLAALGVGGLAVALALQDPLSNLFGGILISLSAHMRIGDYVKIDPNVEGYIVDFDWRTTRIRMLANNIVTVPNAKVAQSIVTNFSQPSTEVAFGVDVSVDFGNDLDKVEAIANEVGREVLRDVSGGVPEADVALRFHTVGPNGITFSVGLKGKTFTDQFLLKHEFVKRLMARFAAEGIVMGLPMRALSARDPLPVTVSPR